MRRGRESPELTLKAVAHARDCRGGKGERAVVMNALVWLRRRHPSTYLLNMMTFLQLGYFKDIMQLATLIDAAALPKLGDDDLIELEVLAEFLRYDDELLSQQPTRTRPAAAVPIFTKETSSAAATSNLLTVWPRSTPVYTSAVVIIPDASLFPAIQTIRRQFDRTYDRWPPHINFLYPFVSEAHDDYRAVAASIQSSIEAHHITAFKTAFNKEPKQFRHKRSTTVWLEPTATSQMQALYKVLHELFSTITSPSFQPHLTLGTFNKPSDANRYIGEWKCDEVSVGWHKEFSVSHLHIIDRADDQPFTIRRSIPLVKEQPDMTGATSDDRATSNDRATSDDHIELQR